MTARTCASWPEEIPAYVEEAVGVVDRALALWGYECVCACAHGFVCLVEGAVICMAGRWQWFVWE